MDESGRVALFVQSFEGVFVLVAAAEEGGAGGGEEALEGTEGLVDGTGFVAGVDHAVGAAGVAGFGAVLVPLGFVQQLLERVGVAVGEKVAGFLPAEDVVRGHAPGRAGVVALAHQILEEKRRLVEDPALAAIAEDLAEETLGFGFAEEVLLVGGFVVTVAGREHHAFDAEGHHLVEEGADGLGVGAVEQRRVGRDPEAAFHRFADSFDGDVVAALAADGEVVVLFLAVHVDGEGEIFAGREEVDLFLEQQGVGAEVDVFLAGDEAFDDLADVGVEEGLAAGDGDHGGAALVGGFEAFFGRELFLEDVGGVLDFAAAGAGEVAAEQRLEHEHEGVLLAAGEALLEHVGCDGPHLGNGYAHSVPSYLRAGRIPHLIEKRKLVILCAVEFESRAVRKALAGREGIDIYTIGIRGGRVPADLRGDEIRCIVMAGLGGALDPKLKVGDVVVDELSDDAIARKLSYPRGKMHTVEGIVSTPQERAELFQRTGAVVVEMENEVVRAIAERLGVAYVGIRAISDSAEQTLDPAVVRMVDDVGRVKMGAVASELLKRPALAVELNRLRKQSAMAVGKLAEAVKALVEKFSP